MTDQKRYKTKRQIANKIFELLGEYIVRFKKTNGEPHGFIWIKNNVTGEILAFAIDIETLKEEVRFLKIENPTPSKRREG